MMETDREQRLRELFEAACQQPPDARSQFLADACGDDTALQERVEALLSGDERKESVLSVPLLADDHRQALKDAITSGRPEELPEQIGQYRVLRKIGSGSMGTVFEAEQDVPRRTVAVKVLRPGVSTTPLLRRFEFEAHILGHLDHQFIARIFDAGTTDSGHGPQPFFAMELVKGRPLTHYAREEGLSTRQRLELLAHVCDAVHHAHTKGVIHRDLKPSNILVDEQGRPRVLDFGVARATDHALHIKTLHTAAGQLVGTLQYMSPEQAAGEPNEIDTRSDIYALGLLGWELLAGRSPYDLDHKALPEALRIIAETDPLRLGIVDKALRGDVETIIAKALQKDKDRRYQSASDMAADLRRHLHDEPIMARPPSAVYQLSKYARRNKGVFGSLAAAFVLLLLGIAGTSYGLVQAKAQQRLAEQRLSETEAARQSAEQARLSSDAARDESEMVTDLLVRMLVSVDPKELGRDVLVRDVLDEASRLIGEELTDSPLIEARLRHAIGRTYTSLGDLADAQAHLEQALEIRRRVLGEEHEDTLTSMNNLATLCLYQGRYDRAEPLFVEVLRIRRREMGETHPSTLNSMNNLGGLYLGQGQYDKAEPLFATVLETRRSTLGEEHPDTLDSQIGLAAVFLCQGRLAEAELLYTKTLEAQRRVIGDEHPDTLITMGNLAGAYQRQGRYDDAVSLVGKALEISRRVLGEEHPHTVASMNDLAYYHQRLGRYDDAEQLYVKTLDIQRRVLGETHPYTLTSMSNFAKLRQEQGRYDEAEPLFLETLETRRRELGEEHPDTLTSGSLLAGLYGKQGRYDEAERLLVATLAVQRRILGEEHTKTLASMSRLAAMYTRAERYAKAEPVALEVLALQRHVLGAKHPGTLFSMSTLGEIYNRTGRCDAAEPVLAVAVEDAGQALPRRHPNTAALLRRYGVCLAGMQRYDESERLLIEAHEILASTLGLKHEDTLEAIQSLADLYDQWGKPGRAAEWHTKLLLAESRD